MLVSVVGCLLLLIILIAWLRLHPFLAFLLTAITGGLCMGMSFEGIIKAIQQGAGDTLGALAIVLALGAMLGKLVADSGAAQQISNALLRWTGTRHIAWAMMVTGFIIGIPLFYNVGFLLMVPLIYTVAAQYRKPLLYVALPLLTALSVTHGFLPPHPSPVALVQMTGASLGKTLLYGMAIAIPVIIIAGPLFAKTIQHLPASPLPGFTSSTTTAKHAPGTVISFCMALLPVIFIAVSVVLPIYFPGNTSLAGIATVLGDPAMALLITLLASLLFLHGSGRFRITVSMKACTEALKEIAPLLLIFAGAGALKQVLTSSGASNALAQWLVQWQMPPLLLGWLMAALIRVCIGSATVAGLSSAGVLLPIIGASGVDPNLMVLSIGAGSLFLSHVNDTGFWMFREYFQTSIPDTFRSWSVMESIVSLGGLIGVLVLNSIIH